MLIYPALVEHLSQLKTKNNEYYCLICMEIYSIALIIEYKYFSKDFKS